ncbi:unnamed protein product [marine sediment metagenome]|uniref:Uncharacterized protein n=1 Tax=marine sediment metagenome TaxID=412755 RepID=X0W6T2_9ZZZZ
MKFIDRGKVIHGNGIPRMSDVPNTGPNCVNELAMAVMTRNRIVVHVLTFECISWLM